MSGPRIVCCACSTPIGMAQIPFCDRCRTEAATPAAPKGLVWRSEPPTEPGWYWWRDVWPDRKGRAAVVQLVPVLTPMGKHVLSVRGALFAGIVSADSLVHAEWCPIPLPSEPPAGGAP